MSGEKIEIFGRPCDWSQSNKMPGTYFIKPKRVQEPDEFGDNRTRLNTLSSTRKSLIYKVGSSTQEFIEDRTKDFGEHELIDKWETTCAGALYTEEHLRNILLYAGYKQWGKKKDYFIVHEKDIDAFIAHVRRICNACVKQLTEMEKNIGCL